MKHAFLVIAHNNPELLKELVSLLDHPDCDIFIHIDLKSDIKQFEDTFAKYSKIYFIEKRIAVKWGTYSQIQTELALFEQAYSHNIYSYYHILSGIDLPIKPIEYILKWFEEHQGYEYLGGWPADKKYHRRMHRRYFFVTRKRNLATSTILAFEKLFGLKWNRKTEVWMGPNWGSFTHKFVEQLLTHREWIHTHFRHSFCGDELYKPTLMHHLGIENRDKGCLRLIDWQRGTPYTFKDEDFEELIHSDKLFARKFSLEFPGLITRLKEHLSAPNNPKE